MTVFGPKYRRLCQFMSISLIIHLPSYRSALLAIEEMKKALGTPILFHPGCHLQYDHSLAVYSYSYRLVMGWPILLKAQIKECFRDWPVQHSRIEVLFAVKVMSKG